jgi:hypothetical protein
VVLVLERRAGIGEREGREIEGRGFRSSGRSIGIGSLLLFGSVDATSHSLEA